MKEEVRSSLHVGLNLMYLEPDSGGSARYAHELIDAMLRVEPGIRISAWVGKGAPEDLDPRVQWVRVPVKSTGSPVHVLVELLGLGFDARRRGIDVVHGLAYASPIIAPGVATVVTILDATWRLAPETVSRMARGMFGLLSTVCGRRADRIIAISDAARDELVATLGLDAQKIDVTPLGVRADRIVEPEPESELRARLGIGDAPVVLSVGQIAAHKNLLRLVEALPLLPESRTVLVVPGRATPYRGIVEARAVDLGVRDRLVLPGFVEEATLEALYRTARVFALPTLMEGFGLPVLEALRRGVPVTCSDIPVLREVAGDTVRYFDPHDPASIANALVDPPDPAAGRARARDFTWERTARASLTSYRRAIEQRGLS